MKVKVIAVIAGALATLLLGIAAQFVLNSIYSGNLPLLPAGLAAFLCSLIGGYADAITGKIDGVLLGSDVNKMGYL